jgi:hypothetical protein
MGFPRQHRGLRQRLRPNAWSQPLPEAAAEWTLKGVGCRAWCSAGVLCMTPERSPLAFFNYYPLLARLRSFACTASMIESRTNVLAYKIAMPINSPCPWTIRSFVKDCESRVERITGTGEPLSRRRMCLERLGWHDHPGHRVQRSTRIDQSGPAG